ncbi:NADPH-dependent aldehyde reductase Ari1p [Trichomonascus vanleenenianus]|uniref:NADPH-dependent aldehyde reductase Ari1p n=1 Tax=Trichomonascus vanleenenianus TaxID=2268995 RepID=UPI003ECA4640
MAQKVLLTGVTGFVGAHVLDILLKQQYHVIATIRRSEQAHFLQSKYSKATVAFVTVPDICQENALDNIMKYNPDIDHVIHLAAPRAPIITEGSDKDIFDPAIKANTNVITAVERHGSNVRTVVITSCFAAMVNDPPALDNPHKIYSSRDVNPITKDKAKQSQLGAYFGARTFAETAAWKAFTRIVDPQFALITIALPLVLGPPIHQLNLDAPMSDSLRYAYGLLDPASKLAHESMFVAPFFIDVRDAALAHVRAIQIPKQTNRWFVASSNICWAQLVALARQQVPELKPRITETINDGEDEELDRQCGFDCSDSDDIAIQYLPLQATVKDMYIKFLKLERQQLQAIQKQHK